MSLTQKQREERPGPSVRDEILRYVAAAFTIEGKGLLIAESEANLQAALGRACADPECASLFMTSTLYSTYNIPRKPTATVA